jgi:hypothetical protein
VGVQGSSGYSGWSGAGESGYSGWSGAQGVDGTSGWSGVSGTSGWSGTVGAVGARGWSGWSGTSGYSGWSGNSGRSGWSGWSGIDYRTMGVTQWTYSPLGAPQNDWLSVCWNPTRNEYCMVGYVNQTAYPGYTQSAAVSKDGLNWTLYPCVQGTGWQDVVWSPELSLYVAIGWTQAAAYYIMTSPDGMTWTGRDEPGGFDPLLQPRHVGYSPTLHKFVVTVAANNRQNLYLSSTNGTTWISEPIGESYDSAGICWSPTLAKFCMTAGQPQAGTARFYLSTDGTNWTGYGTALTHTYGNVCWSEDLHLFVAGAQDGDSSPSTALVTSPDGQTWTPVNPGVAARFYAGLAWAPELRSFVVLSTDGNIITSPDGSAWTQQVAPAAIHSCGTICYSPAQMQFVGVGQVGGISYEAGGLTSRRFMGPQGLSGYSGWSGAGTSGWSGAGTSGYSGWSGYSGLSQKTLILGGAGGMGSVTSGCTGPNRIESATNKVNQLTLDFASAAQKYAEWTAYLPSNYTTAATITATFVWTANSASTNSVVWGLAARAYGNDITIDQAYGTAAEVTDANTATAYQVHISNATPAITIAGSPVAGQLCQFRAYRLGSGADNLAATANLLQVIITYT